MLSLLHRMGGVIDRVNHENVGFLYQHDAPYMLAYYVCQIFENNNLALRFSEKARLHALETHDRETNTKRLKEIYNSILERRQS